MEGKTRMKIRVNSNGIGVLTLRFADSMNVSSVMSDEFGRLLFLRVRNQNSVLVNLPSPVARDFPMTHDRELLRPARRRQNILDESVSVGGAEGTAQRAAGRHSHRPAEPKWLFSNRNYWYPQNQVTDFATARIRLTVPAEYRVVASGIPEAGSPAAAPRRADRRLDAGHRAHVVLLRRAATGALPRRRWSAGW